MDGYYYLHENTQLIFKHKDYPIEDMRDSSFVKAIWRVDLKSRKCAWGILVEALCLGADERRLVELSHKWGCDSRDAFEYAKAIGVDIWIDNDKYYARRQKTDVPSDKDVFIGSGTTGINALADLCKELGYTHSKLGWHTSFEELVK